MLDYRCCADEEHRHADDAGLQGKIVVVGDVVLGHSCAAILLSRCALAVLSLGVVPNVRSWSAPCVLAALAGAVHHCEGAAARKHNCRENN
jgi:hypothetical protein